MRIHTNKLAASDLHKAAARANVYLVRDSYHGSRKRSHAYDVIISGESRYRINGGTEQAATWDQWGIFLAALFEVDPGATSRAYESAHDFYAKTHGRFDPDTGIASTTDPRYHRHHKFEWNGRNVACKCGASR